MKIDLVDALIAEEIKFQRLEHAAVLSERLDIEPELAERIAAMAKTLDQALAIAELMR